MKMLIYITPFIVCSCASKVLTPEVLAGDAINVAAGAATGYLTGGKAGAAIGAATAEAANLRRLAVTASKNPPAKPVAP